MQRLEQIFVSHAHIDHFIGFDRLLRLLVGREKTLGLFGPEGFIDNVRHKLSGYRWNLVDRYSCDLAFVIMEINRSLETRIVRFRLKTAFAAEPLGSNPLRDGVIYREPTFRVSTALLDHRTPCLAFALAEAAHVNVWKPRLADLGRSVGPWLRELKRAVIENRPDDYPIRIGRRPAAAGRIAREAGVRRVEPFHFSPRYAGEEARMLSEVVTAFSG